MNDKLGQMANEQNLIPFKPGDDPRRNLGGRPRKLVNKMKDIGYTASEVNDCFMTILAMNIEELTATYQNADSTALEKACAMAVKNAISRGSLYNIETLLTRALGKPKETVDTTVNGALQTNVQVTVLDTGVPLYSSEKDVLDAIDREKQSPK